MNERTSMSVILKLNTLRSGRTCKNLFLVPRLRLVSINSFLSLQYLTYSAVKKQVTICGSALEACKNAEAVVIATEWKEFTQIAWEEVYSVMNKPAFVFDGRLLVDAEKLTKIGFKVRVDLPMLFL